MSDTIIIDNSVITGIHITGVGSHEAIPLIAEMDNSIPDIDPTCMRWKSEFTHPKIFLDFLSIPISPSLTSDDSHKGPPPH